MNLVPLTWNWNSSCTLCDICQLSRRERNTWFTNDRSDGRAKKEKAQTTVNGGALCRGELRVIMIQSSDTWCMTTCEKQVFAPRTILCFFLAGYWTPIRWICRWGEWVFRLSGKWCCLFCFDFCQYVRLPKIGTLFRTVLLLPQLLWNAAGYICLLCVTTTAKRPGVEPFPPNFLPHQRDWQHYFFSIELGDKQLFQNIVTLSYD